MALGNFAYDYNSQRKEKVEKGPSIRLIRNTNASKNRKAKASRASLVITTLSVFAMLVVISYRYNIISEKNLTVQRLEIEHTEAAALLTNAEVEYNKMVDIVEVEAYAKQQLGMQEPEKSQMVYLASDYEKQVISDSGNFITKIVDDIKQKIKDIF
ncbi:MAG: hypothetical protein IKV94_05690 [Clostridia bacterium]|nr:hypothetical protein [Clostridia bacterium]